MKASIDNVINVPIECADTSKSLLKLPRNPIDAEIVSVQLKRRLEYKKSHLEEFIRPNVVLKALETLKETGNKHYQDIEIQRGFMDSIIDDDVDMETESQEWERKEDERWEASKKMDREERLARRNTKKEADEAKETEIAKDGDHWRKT